MPSVPVDARAMLPSTSAVKITLAHGVSMITFVNTVGDLRSDLGGGEGCGIWDVGSYIQRR